jgi:hypothetical protein
VHDAQLQPMKQRHSPPAALNLCMNLSFHLPCTRLQTHSIHATDDNLSYKLLFKQTKINYARKLLPRDEKKFHRVLAESSDEEF